VIQIWKLPLKRFKFGKVKPGDIRIVGKLSGIALVVFFRAIKRFLENDLRHNRARKVHRLIQLIYIRLRKRGNACDRGEGSRHSSKERKSITAKWLVGTRKHERQNGKMQGLTMGSTPATKAKR
jgi:hypothetical protein